MKKTEIITIDDVNYVTSDSELKIGDCYVFFDGEIGVWGFGDEIKSEMVLSKLNPNIVRRKIISITN